jgi:hypothetical protein
MTNVLDLQSLAIDIVWDRRGGGEGATSCSVNSCSIYRMDGFAG